MSALSNLPFAGLLTYTENTERGVGATQDVGKSRSLSAKFTFEFYPIQISQDGQGMCRSDRVDGWCCVSQKAGLGNPGEMRAIPGVFCFEKKTVESEVKLLRPNSAGQCKLTVMKFEIASGTGRGWLVLKPGERFAEERDRAWHAGGDWTEGLIDDGSPTHLAVKSRADQVHATP